jgi:hypothetical protein
MQDCFFGLLKGFFPASLAKQGTIAALKPMS